MPRIRCHYVDCVFLDDGYCGAAAVEIDPDEGCLTFSRASDIEERDAEWEDEEELEEIEEWDDMEFEEEDEDLWVDDDEF
jgi:hypothetical protein